MSTPNVGSVTSVAKTLDGRDNPQIFPVQTSGGGREAEIGTSANIQFMNWGEAVKAAGFEVKELFTTFIDEFSTHRPLLRFLEANDYSTRRIAASNPGVSR